VLAASTEKPGRLDAKVTDFLLASVESERTLRMMSEDVSLYCPDGSLPDGLVVSG
jgi:hypothetical protein